MNKLNITSKFNELNHSTKSIFTLFANLASDNINNADTKLIDNLKFLKYVDNNTIPSQAIENLKEDVENLRNFVSHAKHNNIKIQHYNMYQTLYNKAYTAIYYKDGQDKLFTNSSDINIAEAVFILSLCCYKNSLSKVIDKLNISKEDDLIKIFKFFALKDSYSILNSPLEKNDENTYELLKITSFLNNIFPKKQPQEQSESFELRKIGFKNNFDNLKPQHKEKIIKSTTIILDIIAKYIDAKNYLPKEYEFLQKKHKIELKNIKNNTKIDEKVEESQKTLQEESTRYYIRNNSLFVVNTKELQQAQGNKEHLKNLKYYVLPKAQLINLFFYCIKDRGDNIDNANKKLFTSYINQIIHNNKNQSNLKQTNIPKRLEYIIGKHTAIQAGENPLNKLEQIKYIIDTIQDNLKEKIANKTEYTKVLDSFISNFDNKAVYEELKNNYGFVKSKPDYKFFLDNISDYSQIFKEFVNLNKIKYEGYQTNINSLTQKQLAEIGISLNLKENNNAGRKFFAMPSKNFVQFVKTYINDDNKILDTEFINFYQPYRSYVKIENTQKDDLTKQLYCVYKIAKNYVAQDDKLKINNVFNFSSQILIEVDTKVEKKSFTLKLANPHSFWLQSIEKSKVDSFANYIQLYYNAYGDKNFNQNENGEKNIIDDAILKKVMDTHYNKQSIYIKHILFLDEFTCNNKNDNTKQQVKDSGASNFTENLKKYNVDDKNIGNITKIRNACFHNHPMIENKTNPTQIQYKEAEDCIKNIEQQLNIKKEDTLEDKLKADKDYRKQQRENHIKQSQKKLKEKSLQNT